MERAHHHNESSEKDSRDPLPTFALSLIRGSARVVERWKAAERDAVLAADGKFRDEIGDCLPDIIEAVARALRGDAASPSGHLAERLAECGQASLIREIAVLRGMLTCEALDFASSHPVQAGVLGAILSRVDGALDSVIALAAEARERKRGDDANGYRDKIRRLEAQAELKSRFISTVAHELRSPLNVVAGVTQILVRTKESLGPNERVADLLARNVDGLIKLVNDLLDYSRLTAGREPFTPASFDPREIVRDSVEALAASASDKGVKLRAETDGAPDNVMSDRVKFGQIVTNLLSNAVKFTSEGEIVVALAREGDASWRLDVRDTGCGIPEHELPHIFEEFIQIERDRGGSRGTGLGLPIVKRVVALLGGTISVTSEPGVGTEFSVVLPLTPSVNNSSDGAISVSS
jgi:signal transduction histidine kinase